jgi:hypothetical protein
MNMRRRPCVRNAMDGSPRKHPRTRGLHSSTSRLHVSTFCGTIWVVSVGSIGSTSTACI